MTATQLPLTWDLTSIYSSLDDPRLRADQGVARDAARQLASAYRGRIASLDATELAALIDGLEKVHYLGNKAVWYAHLRFTAQTDDPAVKVTLDEVQAAAIDIENEVAFADLELAGLTLGALDPFLKAPALENLRRFLTAEQRLAPHQLREAEEQVLNLKNLTGRRAWTQLYTELSAAIRVPVTVDGVVQNLTLDEARSLRLSPEREVRREATNALYAEYAKREQVVTFIFNTLYQDWKQETTLRHYESAIAPTVLHDELDADVVEAVMSVTERNYALAQRWYAYKAAVLSLPDFSSFDTLAPLDSTPRPVTFEEARDMVLQAMNAFSPRAGEIASQFFAGRIDVLPRPGKRGGAFCSSFAPHEHAFVLTNFNGRLDDAFTLAHELGHGLHAELGRDQRLVNYGHSLPLAETASTFNEMLLADWLLKDADESVRRDLMAQRVQDAVNTILRQVQITRWEQRAHEARAAGVVTSDGYSELWMREWTKLHGDSVAPVPGERWGWSVIPHVVNSRFYCYSYAFGMLLVMALFQQYTANKTEFVPRYLDFLAASNSRTPTDLLAGLGVNAQDPRFWQGGFDYLWSVLSDLTGRPERPADLDG